MKTQRESWEKAVGRAMRAARREQGYTLDYMARRLGRHHVKVKQPQLSRYELGEVHIPYEVARGYARVLGLNDDYAIYQRALGGDDIDPTEASITAQYPWLLQGDAGLAAAA